jgi:phage shock protein PspC (stress-responsive transcriptional regulator)
MEHPAPTERRPLSEWHRSGPERRLAGVCIALARELDIPLPAVRAAFVLAVALPGIRVLAAGLYLALWFVTPPEPDEPSALDRALIMIEDLFGAVRDGSKREQ